MMKDDFFRKINVESDCKWASGISGTRKIKPTYINLHGYMLCVWGSAKTKYIKTLKEMPVDILDLWFSMKLSCDKPDTASTKTYTHHIFQENSDDFLPILHQIKERCDEVGIDQLRKEFINL